MEMGAADAEATAAEIPAAEDVLLDPRFWNLEFAWEYLRRCDEMRSREPLRGLELAQIGCSLVARCPSDRALGCFARAVLGSALRTVGRLEEAEAALAAITADLGHIGEEERNEIFSHLALLRRDQQRFDESIELIDNVCRFHRTHGREPDLHKFALASMIRCTINYGAGNNAEALCDIGIALKHIDAERSPENFAAAIHNLACLLQESNHPKDLALAAGYVKSALRIGRFSRRSVPRAKLYWLQGLIGSRLGAVRHAERNFRLAREIFAEHEMPYEVALVALDLGAIYREDARWAELGEIAAELARLVSSRQIEGEIATALELWQKAAAERCVTAKLHERARAALLAGAARGAWDVGAHRSRSVFQAMR